MSYKQFVNRIQSQIARNYASCKEQMSEKIKFGYDIFIKKNKKRPVLASLVNQCHFVYKTKSMCFRLIYIRKSAPFGALMNIQSIKRQQCLLRLDNG